MWGSVAGSVAGILNVMEGGGRRGGVYMQSSQDLAKAWE